VNTRTDAAALEVLSFQWPLSLQRMLMDVMLAAGFFT
jgi:hypothetical protein